MNKQDVTKIQDEILYEVLPHVVFDGWHWDVVLRAAADAGHSQPTTRAVFPAGLIDVLDSFADLADRKMLERLTEQTPDDMRVRDRIHAALIARYTFLQPYKDALRQSIQYWALPTRKLRAAKIVWRSADLIWNWAGDNARDYNRYTKRGLLSGILISSSLYWVNDKSESMDSLESFIDRRIQNVMQFGKIIKKRKRAS